MASLEVTQPSKLPNGTAGISGMSVVDGANVNGANNFSLTEYSAMPTPPSEEDPQKTKLKIPEEFLLSDGTPDVRVNNGVTTSSQAHFLFEDVSLTDRHVFSTFVSLSRPILGLERSATKYPWFTPSI